MLKTRVITAMIMLAVFAVVLVYFDPLWFGGAMLVLISLAAWEWACMLSQSRVVANSFCVLVVAAALTAWLMGWTIPIIAVAVAVWLVSPVVISFITRTDTLPLLVWPLGLLLLGATFLAVMELRWQLNGDLSWKLLLSCLVIVWCADSFAYFAGTQFGKHKLAPSVSPGKTWEGVAGGLLAVLVVSAATWFWLSDSLPGLLSWLVIALASGAVSVLGDLLESSIKRKAGVKDSGTILPGHGGVLDRIDGVLAAAPVFALLYYLV